MTLVEVVIEKRLVLLTVFRLIFTVMILELVILYYGLLLCVLVTVMILLYLDQTRGTEMAKTLVQVFQGQRYS